MPAYGTCAGLILLADDCVGQKAGGQALVGGLDCTVCRNYFGAQVSSFELPLEGFPDAAPAVFIRAPAILKRGPTCEALASVTSAPSHDAAPHVDAFEPAKKKRKGSSSGEREVCVAARQGHILATSFHPELTSDSRWPRHVPGRCASGSHAQCIMSLPRSRARAQRDARSRGAAATARGG